MSAERISSYDDASTATHSPVADAGALTAAQSLGIFVGNAATKKSGYGANTAQLNFRRPTKPRSLGRTAEHCGGEQDETSFAAPG